MEFILIDITSRKSSLNAVKMWELTWYSLSDQRVYVMNVDSSYSNFKKRHWATVVEALVPWGVYSNLKTTDRLNREGLPVLSADSQFLLIYRCCDQTEALRLVELDLTLPANNYKEFYG
jgi:hypothetical protein